MSMKVEPSAEDRLPLETGPDIVPPTRSYSGAPPCTDLDALDAQVAFLGVPFDQGTGVRPGSRFAPDAIREARVYSYGGGDEAAAGYFDIDTARMRLTGVTMADCGNVTIVASDVERNFWRVTRVVRQIVERGSLLVVLGGDHAITPAIMRGFEARAPVDVVHFDAHHDYLDHHEGIRWGHGMALRRTSEFPWVRNITQVGLRHLPRDREPIDASLARGNRILTTDRFRELGPRAAMEVVPESDAIYVSVDIDVLDPGACPGTGSREPGGLTYFEMRDALRALTRRGRVVGLDVVEVSPPLDPSAITSITASRLIIDLLTAVFE